MSDPEPVLERLGMVGTGSMGGNMSLLYAEYGTKVFFFDPVWVVFTVLFLTFSEPGTDEANAKSLLDLAKERKLEDKIIKTESYEKLCKALEHNNDPKHFVFSIPHGDVGDKIVEDLGPHLNKGDIIMDASNEYWKNTERRQHKLEPKGIHYIGMGVSGGYQSARHGPSISPGGDKEGLEKVRPFLEQVAAKDRSGKPCTVSVGPAGSGHYVKMVHNGIEQAMMSILCEVWGIMTDGLGMKYEEISHTLFQWNNEGPLKQNFLVAIGGDICRTKDKNGEFVLENIRDEVVQDVAETEGTGVWTVEESAHLHVPCPSIATAHLFRCASANRLMREQAVAAHGDETKAGKISLGSSKEEAIKILHDTTYATFLMSYIQGLDLIRAASERYEWNLDLKSLMQLWKGGCIIQSDHIVDFLEHVLANPRNKSDSSPQDDLNLLSEPTIAKEIKRLAPSLKKLVIESMVSDQFIPCVSASFEWYKYCTSLSLPTQFMEAELDYFGWHMYDTKSDPVGKPVTGKHHYEWKPAKGINEEFEALPTEKGGLSR